MTISNRDKKLLVYLAAISIVALVYFLFAKPNLDKQQKYIDESSNLRTQVSHYSEILNNQEKYEQQIVDAQIEYNKTLDKFFGGLNQENTIMNIKGIEDATNTWISRISFQDSEIMISDGGTTDGENADSTENLAVSTSELSGMKQDLNLEYACSYSNFKKFIEYIQNYDQRLFISSINASYSADTNQVSGSLVLSQYALVGADREYAEPDLTGIEIGVDNIFSTLKGTTQNDEVQNVIETIENTDVEDSSEDAEGTFDNTNETTNNIDTNEQEEEDVPPPALEDGDNGSGRRNLSR